MMANSFEDFSEEVYKLSDFQWAFYPIARTFCDDFKFHKLPTDYLESLNKPITQKKQFQGPTKKTGLMKILNSRIKILDVAKKYGFVVKNNKAICLFHNDSDPSLNFDVEKNQWFCFGCQQGGNLIDFIVCCKKNNLKIREVLD